MRNPVRIGKVTLKKSNIVLLPRPRQNRQSGEVDLIDNEGHIWGRIVVDYFDIDSPITNADMIYAIEAAKGVIQKNGFFYR